MENRSGIAKPSRSFASQTKASPAKVPQSKADELEERLIDFAVRIIKLTSGLPKTNAGKTSPDRFCDPEPRLRQTTVKQEAQRVQLILFTNSASSLKS